MREQRRAVSQRHLGHAGALHRLLHHLDQRARRHILLQPPGQNNECTTGQQALVDNRKAVLIFLRVVDNRLDKLTPTPRAEEDSSCFVKLGRPEIACVFGIPLPSTYSLPESRSSLTSHRPSLVTLASNDSRPSGRP